MITGRTLLLAALGGAMLLITGAGSRAPAAAGVTTPVPIGTPATKKPIVSKIRAKAYPVRERNEKGRLPRRAKTGD